MNIFQNPVYEPYHLTDEQDEALLEALLKLQDCPDEGVFDHISFNQAKKIAPHPVVVGFGWEFSAQHLTTPQRHQTLVLWKEGKVDLLVQRSFLYDLLAMKALVFTTNSKGVAQ